MLMDQMDQILIVKSTFAGAVTLKKMYPPFYKKK